jgi:conjugal transfer pilus assembly protein TraW
MRLLRQERFTKEWFTKKRLTCCVSALMWCGLSHAASLGVVGEVFPVAEMSFLAFIESRLAALQASGELENIQQRMISDVSAHATRPTPLNIPRASRTSTHFYTPSIRLSSPIIDHQNHILIPAGTSVNAFDTLTTYTPHWLLFNADDGAQVRWCEDMLRQYPAAKVILTQGDVGEMERALKTEIFFDQGGRMSQKLGIHQVPAYVSRAAKSLRIDEFMIGEDGHAH